MTQDTRAPWWHGRGEPLTPEQAQRLREDLRFRLLLGVAAGAGAVVVFLALLLVNQHQHPDKPVRWPLALGISAGMLVALVLLVGVGLWVRSRNRLLLGYVASGDRRTRMRVAKQLRQGRPISEEDRGVARATVEVSRRQSWVPLYFVGLAVLYGVIALVDLRHPDPSRAALQALNVAVPVVMLVLGLWVFVMRRRLLDNAARQGIVPGGGGSGTGSRRP